MVNWEKPLDLKGCGRTNDGFGQEQLDIVADLSNKNTFKTGVFGFSTEVGAILANASVNERRALRSYGLLREGFQMMDDFLMVKAHLKF
jgi:geranylgeranyl pyrophosphate synthase